MNDSDRPEKEGPLWSTWIDSEWWKLAGVLVLGVVLALIGSSVASRFEPSASPGLAASATTIADDEAVETPVVTTTTVPSTEPTTGSPAEAPTTLSLSPEGVDFGDDGETSDLEIGNVGGGLAAWSITSDHPGVSVDPVEGELAAGEAAVVEVRLDRTLIEEGEFQSNITLSWGQGEEINAVVVAVHEDNPIIHNPQASPAALEVETGGDCSPTRTTVTARVRDTSPLESIFVRWSPDGAATIETPMNPIGDDFYEATIGPFSSTAIGSVRVLAFDDRGNAGGASVNLTVAACT